MFLSLIFIPLDLEVKYDLDISPLDSPDCFILFIFLDAEDIKLFYSIFTFIVKIKMDLIKLNAF